MPEPAELKRHRIKCAQLPDRYAQDAALATDAHGRPNLTRHPEHSIDALAAMEWAENPEDMAMTRRMRHRQRPSSLR